MRGARAQHSSGSPRPGSGGSERRGAPMGPQGWVLFIVLLIII